MFAIETHHQGPDLVYVLGQLNYYASRMLPGIRVSMAIEPGKVTVRDTCGLLTITRHFSGTAPVHELHDVVADVAQKFLKDLARNRADYAAQWDLAPERVKTALSLHAAAPVGRVVPTCSLEACEGGLCYQGVQGRPELCGLHGGALSENHPPVTPIFTPGKESQSQ